MGLLRCCEARWMASSPCSCLCLRTVPFFSPDLEPQIRQLSNKSSPQAGLGCVTGHLSQHTPAETTTLCLHQNAIISQKTLHHLCTCCFLPHATASTSERGWWPPRSRAGGDTKPPLPGPILESCRVCVAARHPEGSVVCSLG